VAEILIDLDRDSQVFVALLFRRAHGWPVGARWWRRAFAHLPELSELIDPVGVQRVLLEREVPSRLALTVGRREAQPWHVHPARILC